MAKFFNQIIRYIQNRTFDPVKVINSNKSFLFQNLFDADLSSLITILPAEAYDEKSPSYFTPFSKVSPYAGLTDNTILMGTRYSTQNLNNYACVWSSSEAPDKQVYCIDFDGQPLQTKSNSTSGTLRPALTFTSLEDIPDTAEKDYRDVVRITCGEYPQSAPDQKLQHELDYMLSNQSEADVKTQFYKTGRKFTLYSKVDVNGQSATLKQFDEYFYKGSRYILVDSSIAHLYVTLSNKQMITAQKSEPVWLKVEPVKYVLNTKPNQNGEYVAVSEQALVGCVPFDSISTSYETSNLKIFNELRFLVESLGSQTAPDHYTLAEGYKTISSGVFSNIKGLKSITLPHTLSNIKPDAFTDSDIQTIYYLAPDGTKTKYELPYGQKLGSVGCYADGLIIMSVGERKTDTSLCYVKKDGTMASLSGINSTKINNLVLNGKLDIVFKWGDVRKTLSKNAQQKVLPEAYIMEALGTEPEDVKQYFTTESTGVRLLENNDWFKELDYSSKVQLIRLFSTLGGMQSDQLHQTRVLALIDNIKTHYGSQFASFLSKINLPSGTNHLVDFVMEYKRDKNNQVLVHGGVAQLKDPKQVFYYKQLYKLILNNYTHPNFEEIAHTALTKYHDILSYYRDRLESYNPIRHPGVDPKSYDELKARGIDVSIIQDYMFSSKYHAQNPELQTVLSGLKKQYDLSYDVVSRYDRLITDAKILEAKQLALSKISAEPVRLKYYMPDVEDTATDSKYTFVWPPISSATAITSGLALRSCFRVNGKNESGLINFITDKRDNLMLIFDESNTLCGYMRVSYDLNNRGMVIDTIELNDKLALNKAEHEDIWNCCHRGLMAMAGAMNADGKYVVERINCKPDPYNKVLRTIQSHYPTISEIGARRLEERFYSTKQDIPYQKYFSIYLPTEQQLVIASPELTAAQAKEVK